MTDRERQEIKNKLIELGFWGANEEGDPTSDLHAAEELQRRMKKRFATSFLSSTSFADVILRMREVRIGEDVFVAMCLSALAIPDYLKRHPECAA